MNKELIVVLFQNRGNKDHLGTGTQTAPKYVLNGYNLNALKPEKNGEYFALNVSK